MKTVLPKDLKIGDIVRLNTEAFSDAIVRQIKDGLVHLYRPYGRCDNFEYTGGVICYTGIEEFSIFQDSKGEITRIRESDIERHEEAFRKEAEQRHRMDLALQQISTCTDIAQARSIASANMIKI